MRSYRDERRVEDVLLAHEFAAPEVLHSDRRACQEPKPRVQALSGRKGFPHSLPQMPAKPARSGELWRPTLVLRHPGDSATIFILRRLRVPPTYVLARDHLQRAATILQGTDQRSRQLRHIIERTIGLLDESRPERPQPSSNVLELDDYRHRRQ